jgi:hypothetical protein
MIYIKRFFIKRIMRLMIHSQFERMARPVRKG